MARPLRHIFRLSFLIGVDTMNKSQSVRVLIATQNAGKVREFRRLLAQVPAMFVGLEDLPRIAAPEEDGSTFLANAIIKANYYSRHFGEIALADDSGLVVDALDGAPGVHSARYGGDGISDMDRLYLLLKNLEGVPERNRTARFECAIVVANPDSEGVLQATGIVEGRIIFEPRGCNGFGYDPVFVPDGKTRTTGEMSADEKDSLSHRARAIDAIAPALNDLLCDQ